MVLNLCRKNARRLSFVSSFASEEIIRHTLSLGARVFHGQALFNGKPAKANHGRFGSAGAA